MMKLVLAITWKIKNLYFREILLNELYKKTARYDRIINELCHFYIVSLITTRLMFRKYHLLNQLQVFMRYKKLPK
jgi:hypothetical protein